MEVIKPSSQAGKATPIRGIAVRETSVSRHHVRHIQDLPEATHTSRHYRIECFKGGPYLGLQYAERSQSLG